MKKTILIILGLLLLVALFAEPVVATYTMTGVKMDVEAASDGKLFVSVNSNKTFVDKPFLILPASDVEVFRGELMVLKNKYIEWKDTAEKNNVTELTKIMPGFENLTVRFGWMFGGYNFSKTSCTMTPIFSVNNGVYGVGMVIPEQVSSSNQFMKWDRDVVMLFVSPAEIQSLYDATCPSKVKDAYDAANKKDDMFK